MVKEGSKVLVRQTRSYIGRTQRVRDTLKALGLGRIGKSKEITVNPATVGMIRKVRHLVSVTEV
jgi:large subunit ribosomal protein L30